MKLQCNPVAVILVALLIYQLISDYSYKQCAIEMSKSSKSVTDIQQICKKPTIDLF